MNYRTLQVVVTLVLGLSVLAGLVFHLWRISRPVQKIEDLATVPLADVLAAVKREIEAATPYLSTEDLPLASVKLELQVVVLEGTSGEGKAMLLPLGITTKASASEVTSRTQTVTVLLEPPSPNITKSEIDLTKLGLASAIRAVHEGLRSGMNQPPRLEPKKIEIVLAFGVKRQTASSSGLELKAFGGALTTTTDIDATQKIELVFAQAKTAVTSKEVSGWD
ncbi:MAG: trypco2 family protein [Acidobacteriota bacterium]